MDIQIHKLSPDFLDDYLSFFDNMVFTENPHWGACYCYSFHFTGNEHEWNRKNNRAAVSDMICENKLRGFMAFDNNKAVGWCNANIRANYQALNKSYALDNSSGRDIGSVVCFVVRPEYRGKGIAGELLKTAIKDFQDQQIRILEAYPEKNSSSCEKNYKGPLAMYIRSGFEVISEHGHYYIVRKYLENQ